MVLSQKTLEVEYETDGISKLIKFNFEKSLNKTYICTITDECFDDLELHFSRNLNIKYKIKID